MNSQAFSERKRKILEVMKLVEDVSLSLDTITWLWGGLVVDVIKGKFLREHDDLDYLTMNLHQLKSQISEKFINCGWSTKNLENGDLKLTKDDVKIHLGHIELSDKVNWTHNGEKGSLFFPLSWLPFEVIDFYGAKVHVVSPELQYVLKNNPKLLNPEWESRDKDFFDLETLGQILANRGIEFQSLHEMVTDV